MDKTILLSSEEKVNTWSPKFDRRRVVLEHRGPEVLI